MIMLHNLGIPLCNQIIYIVALVSGADAFGASSIPMRRFWMTLRTTGPWNCCMTDSVYAIEPGKPSWTLRLVPPTLRMSYFVKSSLSER
jgi:hypothetical protein